jgi:hypothetical protein
VVDCARVELGLGNLGIGNHWQVSSEVLRLGVCYMAGRRSFGTYVILVRFVDVNDLTS